MQEDTLPIEAPPHESFVRPALFTWYFKDLVQANRMAIFFEGHSMIMRVNRADKSVDLLGFEDDEDEQ